MGLFDHTVLSAWTGDCRTRAALSFDADLDAMLRFEVALAQAQAALGLIPETAARDIAAGLDGFTPDMDRLRNSATGDGVVVPGLIAQLRAVLPADSASHLHFGATSQDVVDTALMLRLRPLLADYATRLRGLAGTLDTLSAKWGERPLMAVTRMRDALPMTVSDRLQGWRDGLVSARAEIERTRDGDLALQLAGPIGTLGKFGPKGPALRADVARRLDLVDPGRSWHVERSRLLRIGGALAATTTALGKIGMDLAMMAQDAVGTVVLEGGNSSSMPHKVNPVDAELLVTLSRIGAAQLGMLGQAAVHDMERSGIAWTLEWAALPDLLNATGGGLRTAERLLGSIRGMGAHE